SIVLSGVAIAVLQSRVAALTFVGTLAAAGFLVRPRLAGAALGGTLALLALTDAVAGWPLLAKFRPVVDALRALDPGLHDVPSSAVARVGNSHLRCALSGHAQPCRPPRLGTARGPLRAVAARSLPGGRCGARPARTRGAGRGPRAGNQDGLARASIGSSP